MQIILTENIISNISANCHTMTIKHFLILWFCSAYCVCRFARFVSCHMDNFNQMPKRAHYTQLQKFTASLGFNFISSISLLNQSMKRLQMKRTSWCYQQPHSILCEFTPQLVNMNYSALHPQQLCVVVIPSDLPDLSARLKDQSSSTATPPPPCLWGSAILWFRLTTALGTSAQVDLII